MTDSAPILHIVLASTRPGRAGEPVAHWIEGVARDHGAFDVQLVDLAEVNLPFVDEPEHPIMRRYTQQHTRDWSARVDAADAFVFVTPEYNYGFCAPLKNALDFLFHEWRYKPVGFVSYGQIAAGTRGVQMLKQVLDGLRLSPIGPNVALPFVQELIADGQLQPNEIMEKAAAAMLDELRRIEEALRPLRVEARSALAPVPS
jgi:NAD(P)H-dependent FMN reductase